MAAIEADVVSREDDSEARWLPYVLPLPPLRYLRSFRLECIMRAVAQRKRRAEVQVLLPLQPFLTNLAVARQQAAHKIHQQYLEACKRVEAGGVSLPYHFVIRTTNPTIIDHHAETVADLKIALEPIELPVTLWHRASWTLAHAGLHTRNTLRNAKRQLGPFAPRLNPTTCSSDAPLAEYFGSATSSPPGYSAGLTTGFNHNPALTASAARLGLPRGAATNNGELLNPGSGDAQYFFANASPGRTARSLGEPISWHSLRRSARCRKLD